MDINNSVLIIEDDIDLIKLYEMKFKGAGFNVDTATDGRMGLELAKKGGYSIIILDVMLPVMDGFSVLAELNKNQPTARNGPVIFLTNLAKNKIVEEAKSTGVTDVLSKTEYTPSQLVEISTRLATAHS
jgi:CheY-like chemotaxis protein